MMLIFGYELIYKSNKYAHFVLLQIKNVHAEKNILIFYLTHSNVNFYFEKSFAYKDKIGNYICRNRSD